MKAKDFNRLNIKINPKANVLDLGSFDAQQNKWMIKDGYKYQGLDLLIENKYVKKADFVEWLRNNDKKFDLILAEFSLQQIDKSVLWITLKNINRSLKKDGYFFFSSFNEYDSVLSFFSYQDFLKMGKIFEILNWENSMSKDMKGRDRCVTSILFKKN